MSTTPRAARLTGWGSSSSSASSPAPGGAEGPAAETGTKQSTEDTWVLKAEILRFGSAANRDEPCSHRRTSSAPPPIPVETLGVTRTRTNQGRVERYRQWLAHLVARAGWWNKLCHHQEGRTARLHRPPPGKNGVAEYVLKARQCLAGHLGCNVKERHTHGGVEGA